MPPVVQIAVQIKQFIGRGRGARVLLPLVDSRGTSVKFAFVIGVQVLETPQCAPKCRMAVLHAVDSARLWTS
jgi:hypothetical protein